MIALLTLAGGAQAQTPGAFDVGGTEPFWDVQVRPGHMRLHDDVEAFSVGATGPVRRARTIVWRSLPRHRSWRVELTPGRCDDGMSERIYHYSARVWLDGQLALRGCADPARPARR